MQPLLDTDARRAVGDALRAVAETEIRPRFRALAEHHIHLKGPGDFVTEADLAAEQALTPILTSILDIPVVGEEAAAADPSVEDAVSAGGPAWTLDPVDGTANFVAGSEAYAVMVGLVDGGRSLGGWIYQPELGRMLEGIEGVGAFVNGEPLSSDLARGREARAALAGRAWTGGAVSLRYAQDTIREGLAAAESELGGYGELRMCAGFDYADLLLGNVGYLVYTRAKPWDHVPGAGIAAEAGFTVGRVDGSGYDAGETAGAPLLAARNDHWESIREVLARHLGL